MSRPVVIVNYNPRWPAFYEEEKRRILCVAGHSIFGIEHIGSTAVVGLSAKPIIDIMAGVKGRSDADELLSPLKEIGYEDVNLQLGDLEWYYCLGKSIHGEENGLHNFHLHLMQFGSETWKRHILFRDLLRNNPEAALKYGELKRKLAEAYSFDRENYTKTKTDFITSAVIEACRK